MDASRLRSILVLYSVLSACLLCACRSAQKTLILDSEPSGATAWINGEKQKSLTPVRVPFEWYGSFEVRLEKEGYESLATEVKVDTEIDGYPVIDLVLLPFAKDKTWRRTLPLKPLDADSAAATIDSMRSRAETFRGRTHAEVQEPGTPDPSPEAPSGR